MKQPKPCTHDHKPNFEPCAEGDHTFDGERCSVCCAVNPHADCPEGNGCGYDCPQFDGGRA